MKVVKVFVFFGVVGLLGCCEPAHALGVVINEFLADPASSLAGDANGDGTSSSSQDEFIELVNVGGSVIDLSGWTLADSVQTRHIFSASTFLNPNEFLVVFGGGSPSLPGVHWQIASTGTLSLNNSGDQISFFDQMNNLVDQVIYGSSAGNDQSLTRNPDGFGTMFEQHATIPAAGGAVFSPGRTINGQLALSVIPEPITVLSFGLGALGLMRYRKKKVNV